MKKALFKPKPKTPVELVRHARELIIFLDSKTCTRESKREEKLSDLSKTVLEIRTVLYGNGELEPNAEACSQITREFFKDDTFRLFILYLSNLNLGLSDLSKMILEIRTVLYGNGESEPNADACSQITREFFKDDTFRLFILYLSNLKLGARQDATHVIANLQRQRVNSQLIASQYLEKNLDLVDMLIDGYEKEGDIALSYGAVARECIRHQSVARHILESEHMKKFFDYIQLPNFEIASDAVATFKVC
ncbi:Putative MO25-like protein [Glycine soja]|uniref:Putative MO25-like protein n=1 Tax=Glycine soja TaxID=3848 RepID=A0A0B2SPR3_GLYSO|nr:Putative MO25-like protein [Glycine soja]